MEDQEELDIHGREFVQYKEVSNQESFRMSPFVHFAA